MVWSLLLRYLMFPCYEHKLKWDDYGEIVRPEDWADTKPDEETVNAVLTSNQSFKHFGPVQ
jgi:hypothetical protein